MTIDEGFEWDEQKAASNLLKHRVSFVRAAFAFRDLSAVEIADTRQDYGEERVLLIGLERGELLAVLYTERGAKIRIISARRADADERRYYQRQNAK
jgi:uncharacterized DUF497 family protein